MENVLKINIGSNNFKVDFLKKFLLKKWQNIKEVHVKQKNSFVIFSNVEDSIPMEQVKSFDVKGYVVQVQKLNKKSKKDFLSVFKEKSTCQNSTKEVSVSKLTKSENLQTRNVFSSQEIFLESTEQRINEFLNNYPESKEAFLDLYKKEMEKLNLEVATKVIDMDNLNEKTTTILQRFDHDTEGLGENIPTGFKYTVKPLKNDDEKFLSIKNSFGLNIPDKNIRVYGVVANSNGGSVNSDILVKPPSLLLHGTKGQSVKGILKYGFRPSIKGLHGPGLYLTDSIHMAHVYGSCYGHDASHDGTKVAKKLTYVFVCQVPPFAHPEKSQLCRRREKIPSFTDYVCSKPEIRAFNACSNMTDALEKKYGANSFKKLKGSFQTMRPKVVLAHHNLVKPAFLVEIKHETNVNDLVKELLKDKNLLKIKADDMLERQTENIVKKCSFDNVTKRLEKEIIAKDLKEIKLLRQKFNSNITLLINNLLFDINLLLETKVLKDFWYRTEIMNKNDKDYEFIVNSVTDEKSQFNPKLLHLFKINPSFSYEIKEMQGKLLYLHGIKASKVVDVLNFGYPKSLKHSGKNHSKDNFSGSDFVPIATNLFKQEILKGLSHCKTTNGASKLSFVFVVSSKENAEQNQSEQSGSNAKLIGRASLANADSRGCCVPNGSFRSFENSYFQDTIDVIPAYLIVYKL